MIKVKLIWSSGTTEDLELKINLFLIDVCNRNNAKLIDVKANVKDMYACITYSI